MKYQIDRKGDLAEKHLIATYHLPDKDMSSI